VIEKHLFNALVGRNLRRLRRSADLTLEQLGDALGVSLQQLHKHERGRGVSLWRAVQICRALDVPLSELIPSDLDRDHGLADLPPKTKPGSIELRLPQRNGSSSRPHSQMAVRSETARAHKQQPVARRA
jgi:transcriptional regulator with XRE-family HTH domain